MTIDVLITISTKIRIARTHLQPEINDFHENTHGIMLDTSI